MAEPLVTLVMPAWRPREDWLRAAVGAALAQTHERLELIVVDDGSPEPVEALLGDVGDARLRVLSVEHGGVSHARNEGIAAARGAYLRFLDADDVALPDSTERLLRLTAGRDDVIAYGATAMCDGRLRHRWTMTSDVRGDASRKCLLGEFAVRPVSMLFPRRVVERVGPWDEEFAVSGDWDWVLRALEVAPVVGERAVMVRYRKHAGGVTRGAASGEQGARRVVDRYFERHPELVGTALERRARARLDVLAARVLLTRGRVVAAVPRLARGVARDPRALVPELRQGLPALAGVLRGR